MKAKKYDAVVGLNVLATMSREPLQGDGVWSISSGCDRVYIKPAIPVEWKKCQSVLQNIRITDVECPHCHHHFKYKSPKFDSGDELAEVALSYLPSDMGYSLGHEPIVDQAVLFLVKPLFGVAILFVHRGCPPGNAIFVYNEMTVDPSRR